MNAHDQSSADDHDSALRSLGGNLSVGPIGYGCMSLSGAYGPADDDESITVLQRAVELGVTLFDTADMYGDGHNERLIGRALAPMRSEITIATKFGFVRDADSKLSINGHPDHVRAAADASLARLGVDAIDLYYAHRVDAKVPVEETVGAMAELVTAGKVRHLGLSEPSVDSLRRAHAVHPITAVQTECSLSTRHALEQLLPALDELGIGFVPYSPLGRGLLTATVTGSFEQGDFRPFLPRFSTDHLGANQLVAERIADIATRHGATAAQVALAWVLDLGPQVVPIPGTRSATRLQENVEAQQIVLTDEDRRDLEAAAASIAGGRYPDALLELVDR